jgi:hypothetical protein
VYIIQQTVVPYQIKHTMAKQKGPGVPLAAPEEERKGGPFLGLIFTVNLLSFSEQTF